MSRAIAAARPSIKSAVAAGRQPTPQSTKQTRPMADCRSASIKALPRRRPAAIIPPLRRLVSPRLTRRSHPDCRAIKIYGADFEGLKRDYDNARDHASNLRRWRNLQAALPEFLLYLS